MKKIIINSFLLPLLLFRDIHHSKRSIFRKIGFSILILIFFGIIWWNGLNSLKATAEFALYELGIQDRLTNIQVVGTSMLPTIKDGEKVTLKSPKKSQLFRGDIVSFKNSETGNLSYLKRIIGLPKERISIRNGYVYINNKALDEEYTLNKSLTFGNTFLLDCETMTVPNDYYFVMGDNRIVSSDSRIIGFVNKNNIEGVIKGKVSPKFLSEKEQKRNLQFSVDPVVFLKKLNEKRAHEQKPLLVTHQTLNNLATKRVGEIRDNFGNWKKKIIPLNKLMDESGYRYNLIHEFVTFGYLSEQNIVDQIFELPIEKDEFLSPQYTEVGIGVTERTIGECQYPIISVILSWPTAPTYELKVVDTWLNEINITENILNTMQTWVGVASMDQEKVRKIIELSAQQNQIAVRIHEKMKKSEWLTSKDYQDINIYENLTKETSALIEELFGKKVKGATSEDINSRRL